MVQEVALLIALVVAAGLAGHFLDPDKGGYVDSPFNKATYPKKEVHLVHGAVVCFLLALWFPLWYCFGVVLVVGAVYEKAQGFFSWLDLLADVVGAGLVCLIILARFVWLNK